MQIENWIVLNISRGAFSVIFGMFVQCFEQESN